jgi:hypothetical protein
MGQVFVTDDRKTSQRRVNLLLGAFSIKRQMLEMPSYIGGILTFDVRNLLVFVSDSITFQEYSELDRASTLRGKTKTAFPSEPRCSLHAGGDG